MFIVNETNLNTEKGEIFYLGKYNGGEENEVLLNILSFFVKEMYFMVN